MSPKAFQTFCRYSVPLKSSSVRHWRCQKLPSFLKEWEENGLNAMLWASLYQSWDCWALYLSPVAECQECLHCKQEHVLNRAHTLPNFNGKNSQLPLESCIVLTRFLNGPCDLSTWSKIKKHAMTDAFFQFVHLFNLSVWSLDPCWRRSEMIWQCYFFWAKLPRVCCYK